MDKVSFEIFEAEKKPFRFTPDWIIGILWFTPLLMLWLFNGDSKPNGVFGTIVTTYFIGVFVITIYFLIVSFSTYKPLKGRLAGEIQFEKDRIIVNGTFFSLQDIRNLEFNFGDYFGEKDPKSYKSVNPMLSQGVDNYVSFADSANQNQLIYFKITGPHSRTSLAPFINEAIKMKKMELKHGIDLIGIENVNA